MKPNDVQKAYAKLVAAAWADDAVKQRLMESPKEVLKEYGVEVPEGVDIRVLADTADTKYVVLPAKPVALEIESIGERNAASYGFGPDGPDWLCMY